MHFVVESLTEVRYLELKVVLAKEQGLEFSMEDVREIVDNLVEFYTHVAYLKEKYKPIPPEQAGQAH